MNEITPFEAAGRSARASQATMVEQSRAVAEVQAAVVVAQNRPRDKMAAIAEMREVCAILPFAERAFFSFSRGGSAVKGETVHMARELARCWGNITCGIVELSRDEISGKSEMMAFAWDLQTNDRQQTTFIVPHSRDTKSGKKALMDDRDIYENNANMGARRLREMIFAVLPVWFRDEAADICRYTLAHGGGKPLTQRIADCIAAFAQIGVDRDQLEKLIGRKPDAFTPEDVASLGVTFKSIQRGEITKDELFPRDRSEEKDVPANADSFEKAAAGKKAKEQEKPAEVKTDPVPPTAAKPADPKPVAEQPKQSEPEFAIITVDGEELPYDEHRDFANAFQTEMRAAADAGKAALDGFMESNAANLKKMQPQAHKVTMQNYETISKAFGDTGRMV